MDDENEKSGNENQGFSDYIKADDILYKILYKPR